LRKFKRSFLDRDAGLETLAKKTGIIRAAIVHISVSCFKVEALEDIMSIHHPDSSDQPVRKVAGRAVMCKICQAIYVPARTHVQLARSPQSVVESAFMSMCHFCFRCRRPACPGCWDDVHGVCGACVVDAQLSFRSSVPPLDGVMFPPTNHVRVARVHTLTPPLVCVQPGRFQDAPLPIETQTTLYMQAISDQPIYDPRVHSEKHALNVISRQDKFERIATEIVSLIVLLIIIVIASALFSPSVNDGIAHFLHVDIRAEIAYLLHLIQHLF
jgi:hypothetical protein